MPELHLVRAHTLGLDGARQVAARWRLQAEKDYGMTCLTEPGQAQDRVHFKRSGVRGELTVREDRFELQITLGFLLGAFKDRIEAEIVKNLDSLLQAKPAGKKKRDA